MYLKGQKHTPPDSEHGLKNTLFNIICTFFFNVEEAKVVKAIVTVLGVLVGSMNVLGLGHY